MCHCFLCILHAQFVHLFVAVGADKRLPKLCCMWIGLVHALEGEKSGGREGEREGGGGRKWETGREREREREITGILLICIEFYRNTLKSLWVPQCTWSTLSAQTRTREKYVSKLSVGMWNFRYVRSDNTKNCVTDKYRFFFNQGCKRCTCMVECTPINVM